MVFFCFELGRKRARERESDTLSKKKYSERLSRAKTTPSFYSAVEFDGEKRDGLNGCACAQKSARDRERERLFVDDFFYMK
jgi:hypothetical protein